MSSRWSSLGLLQRAVEEFSVIPEEHTASIFWFTLMRKCLGEKETLFNRIRKSGDESSTFSKSSKTPHRCPKNYKLAKTAEKTWAKYMGYTYVSRNTYSLLKDKHFTSNTSYFILCCAGLHVSVFIDHPQARLWIVFYKFWLHNGIPLCLQLCQCVYLLYKYIKVGGRNSEWYKNYTWMLGMLLRMSDCVSSGVFGVLVDL